MTAKTKLLTLGDWYEWAYQKFGRGSLSGLAGLEQAMYQSIRSKVCVRCLSKDNIILQTGRYLVKSTDYYLCQECLNEVEKEVN